MRQAPADTAAAGGTRSPFGTDQMAAAGLHAGVSIHSTTGASTRVRLSPTHTIVVFTRATAGVTCTAATRGGQRASDGRTPAAAQPRALAPVPQSGVQPPPAHGARCPGEQEARSLGPASHVEARAPDAHRPRSARLPHSARSGAQCAAHGLARVQTAFSTSRTSEVPADLRMGES